MLQESMANTLRNTVSHDVHNTILEPETQVEQPFRRHRRRRARGVEVSAQSLPGFEGRVARGEEPRDLGHLVAAGDAQVPAFGAWRLHEEHVRVARVLDVCHREAPEPRVNGDQQRVEFRVTCNGNEMQCSNNNKVSDISEEEKREMNL